MRAGKLATLAAGLGCSLAIMVLGIAGQTAAQREKAGGGGGSCSANLPVTSILNDAGNPVDGTNYRVESDNVGSYYQNGPDSVSSILQESATQCTGDWVLDTSTSAIRGVMVDLRAGVPGGATKPPFGYEILPTRIIVKCHVALAGSFPAMSLNQTLSCPMFVAFTTPSGGAYRLVMSSGPNSGYDLPETNNAQVTCTAVSSGHCSSWTIQPVQQPNSGPVENIAQLQENTNKFPNLGDFYASFLINVTGP